jgi:hypothetical protein
VADRILLAHFDLFNEHDVLIRELKTLAELDSLKSEISGAIGKTLCHSRHELDASVVELDVRNDGRRKRRSTCK